MSLLMLGLSTFLVPAQVGSPRSDSQPATTAEEGADEKPNINEIIETSNVFTNSVGMVLKKNSAGLWISAYETTQKQYEDVTGANPSSFRGDKRPVDSVSWQDASAFCSKLTDHEKAEDMLPDGYHYTLPSQELWEQLANGVPLANAVTSSGNPRPGTANTGSLPPSGAGLYDLRGNVAEWAADPADGAYRVLRGGSWEDWIDINLRLQFRIMVAPSDAKNTYGFRCVLAKTR